jgi:hypothetical protein
MLQFGHRVAFILGFFFFGLTVLERILFQLEASPFWFHTFKEPLLNWGVICLLFAAVFLLAEIRRALARQ